MEPYKIKTVEPIFLSTKAERQKILKKAYMNLFLIPARYITIDLLTDSGTGAMSAKQWGALLTGDESYAGAESFFYFEKTVKDITGMDYVIPVHQGRAAERILLDIFKDQGKTIISNTLFDTTRANAMHFGLKVYDFPTSYAQDSANNYPFKGNIDCVKLEKTLKTQSVSAVIFTITNNSGGGQPASLQNIRKCRQICQKYKVPLILDACRFAENTWFIQQKEKGLKNKTPKEIAKEIFNQADLCFVSAKKDGLSNIGGFIGVREKNLSEECKKRLILSGGFPTYGGLAGRDLSAIAIGLQEVLEESYLKNRIESVGFLHTQLAKAKVPLVNPSGGHAVYIDVKKLLPHIPASAYPGQAFVCGLYEFAGIRSFEVGSVMMGWKSKDGKQHYAPQEWVRLAIPRRVYSESHLNYVAKSIISFIKTEAKKLKGVRFVKEPTVLRHFTAHFEWILKN